MAYAAVNQPTGFEYYKTLSPDEFFYIPGDPGVTYNPGDLLVKNAVGATADAGLFVKSADSGAAPLLVVEKKVVVPAAGTAGFPIGGPGSDNLLTDDGNVANTLVPCRLVRGAGVNVFNVPMEGYLDDTLAAYTEATPSITLTTSPGADDDPNGGIVWIHTGTGAGQWNWIVDYVHSTKVATLARKFEIAPDTTSEVIILEGGGSGVGGIGTLGRVDSADHDAVDVDDGADDGDWIVLLDAREIHKFMKSGSLPVALYSQFV